MSKSADSKLSPNQEFHMYVGYCITAWAKVDEHLFNTFQEILGSERHYAAIVYYKSPGINTRISLVDELVKAALPKTQSGKQTHPDLAKWKDINAKFSDLLGIRRQVAHQPVQATYRIRSNNPAYADLPKGTPMPPENFTLIPSFYLFMSASERLRGRSEETTKRLNVDSLSVHATEVGNLAVQIRDFGAGPLQAYLQKPTPPKSLRRLARPRKKAKKK